MTPPIEDTGKVPVGDIELFFRRFVPAAGQDHGEPVLILHGLSYFSYDWVDIARRIATDRQVVAMDLRGFGQSGWSPAREYGLRTLAGDVVAVLDHLEWPRAVLMGHSMGGRIALCTTGGFPGRVSRLICIDFAPDVAAQGRRHVAERIGNQPDLFDSVDHALAYHGYPDAEPDSPVRKRFEAFLERKPNGFQLRRDLHFRDQFRETLRTGKSQPSEVDLWALLEGTVVPSLFVRGSSSDMFAPETLPKVSAANPLAQAIEIEGSHDLAGDNPEGVVRSVRRFLGQQPTTTSTGEPHHE
jgi:pimeloyl-ACP methyl ester carboxylesterase